MATPNDHFGHPTVDGLASGVSRLGLIVCGAAGVLWSATVLPVLHRDYRLNELAFSISAGDKFRAGLLEQIDKETAVRVAASSLRPALRGKAAAIELRLAEDALKSRDTLLTAQRLKNLDEAAAAALRASPVDPFMWLARFWVINTHRGFGVDSIQSLRASYQLGPYEGWVAVRRASLAMTLRPLLPDDLIKSVSVDFAELVLSGLNYEAADIAAGPGRPFRRDLFEAIKGLSIGKRRLFAAAFYSKELDDVPVPGVAPPVIKIPVPILPPGL